MLLIKFLDFKMMGGEGGGSEIENVGAEMLEGISRCSPLSVKQLRYRTAPLDHERRGVGGGC